MSPAQRSFISWWNEQYGLRLDSNPLFESDHPAMVLATEKCACPKEVTTKEVLAFAIDYLARQKFGPPNSPLAHIRNGSIQADVAIYLARILMSAGQGVKKAQRGALVEIGLPNADGPAIVDATGNNVSSESSTVIDSVWVVP